MSRRCLSVLSGLVLYTYCSSLRLSWSYMYFLNTVDRSMSLMRCLMHWRSVVSSITHSLSWTHYSRSVRHCSGCLHYSDKRSPMHWRLSISRRSSRSSVRSRSLRRSLSSSRLARSSRRKTLRKIHIGRFILLCRCLLLYTSTNFLHSLDRCS